MWAEPKNNKFCAECGVALSDELKEKQEQLLKILRSGNLRRNYTTFVSKNSIIHSFFKNLLKSNPN
jgi:16S rRNA G527 N7-methylase RsmG